MARLDEIVKKQNVDLIVMGTHGRKGVSRALLGSAAEEIFRKAYVPGSHRRTARVAKHGTPHGYEADTFSRLISLTSLLRRFHLPFPWRRSISRT